MNELTLLRTLRDDVPEPTSEQLAPAFAQLESKMNGETVRHPIRSATRARRLVATGGVALISAAAVTAAVIGFGVLPSPVGPGAPVVADPNPTTSPSETAAPEVLTASMVLARAADHVSDPHDLLVHPGQLLQVETSGEYLQPWSAQWSQDGDPNTFPFNSFDEADGAILYRDVRQLYVPADRDGDWIWVWNPQEIVETFGGPVDQMLADAALPENAIARATTGRFTAPAGNMPGRDGEGFFPLDSNRPYYAEMPREPQALLDWYRARSGDSGPAADRWVVSSIDPLVINLAPADIRAATFRALSLIDGLTVTQHDDRLATIDYRAADGMTFSFVIDMEYGYLQSVAQTWNGGERIAPASVPDYEQTVTMTVVDDAP